ncbi:PAS domain-containing protein [Hymenobacter fodinae]|uniref:histidine kinase n=1 Tax=Hymenobacter fodinae TaxID=2510796 RepID=A0A4Z0P6J6_9BACT|nr:PAS domain-containing protein [Hymenobacter fodinae]TGE08022.1 PAS domain S-box protein [Hymenobacter fodinae]
MNPASSGSDLSGLFPVFNALPGAYLLLSPSLVIEAVSDAYVATTLTTREALLGQSVLEVFSESEAGPEVQSLGNLRASLEQVLATGKPHEMARLRYDLPDPAHPGQFVERHWLPLNTPVLDDQGTVQHILHRVVDVTERVQEEARRQSDHLAIASARREEARLSSLFMEAPAAICILNGPSLVYELVNPSYQELFPGRELLGKPILAALPEIADHEVYRTLRQVFDTGITHKEQEILIPVARNEDGELEDRYFNYIQQPRYDDAGHINGVVVFAFEVTAQVVARQQSEAVSKRLKLLTNALPVLISYVDRNHRYQFANQAYESWFNLSADEFVDQPVQGVLGEEAYQRARSYIERALAGERLEFDLTMPYRHDFVRHIHTSYVPDVQDGTVLGFYSLIADVTEQVQAREKVQALNEELAVINEELAATNEELQTSNEELLANHTQLIRTQQAVLEEAQRRIRERETFYQVFEQTPACIALMRGPAHRFEYVNAAYQQLFPLRQLVGQPVAEALPETVQQGFLQLLDTVYRTGETFFGTELPLNLQQPDGTTTNVYFTFTYQAYREQEQIVGISIFAYDVTEQVQARQAREAQQRQLHELFMQAPAPIAILTGPEMVFQLVNPAYQAIFPGRDLLNRPALQALPELADSPIPAVLQQVYTTGETYVAKEMQLMVARHEGDPLEELYFTFTYEARLNAQGASDGIMVFAHEVTDQVLARRVVEEREESFRKMANNVPAMLWVNDPQGQCVYLNQQWYVYTGQTEAEALGLGWLSAVHPDEAAEAETTFLDANARRVPFHAVYRLRRHDGIYRWVSDAGAPRFSEQGEFEGFVGTVVDVHEQRLAELALQRLTKKLRTSRDETQALNINLRASNAQLTRTNVDLDNFIYTASHDLKAPITNIEGLLHMLQNELVAQHRSDEVAHILALMQDSVDRFTRTIEHLTDVSKLQKEHDQPASQVSLAPVIDEVSLDLAPLLLAVNGRLHVAVEEVPTVMFPEKNLRSVVYNLLSNALKYHHPDRTPEVYIRARTEADYLVLEVQDNGLGFDLTRERQLFAMFQRLHTHVEGSGVGLYMVKRMVENAGGRIEVHSEVGHGATFTIYFKR